MNLPDNDTTRSDYYIEWIVRIHRKVCLVTKGSSTVVCRVLHVETQNNPNPLPPNDGQR
jgi:hypothetical protein